MKNQNELLPTTIIVRSSEIPTVDLNGEIGMMSIKNGKYYGLDSIGSHLWNLIDKPISLSGLLENIKKEYDVAGTEYESDVFSFLNNLLSEELIKVVEE